MESRLMPKKMQIRGKAGGMARTQKRYMERYKTQKTRDEAGPLGKERKQKKDW